MSETQFVIGTTVRCTDGVCGRLQRIIIDAVGNRLTYLAVKPDGSPAGRLVPADRVESVGTEILLRSSAAEFAQFEAAEETAPQHQASWPYSPLDLSGRFPAGVEGVERDTGYGNRTPTRDRIPAGGLEVRRGEPVYATDGEIGRVQGLSIDLQDRHLIRLLLDKGHLWGRTRFTIPVGSVDGFGDGIQLDLTKEQVRELLHASTDRDD